MASTISLIVYPAKDLAATKAFYNAFLGTEPYADGDYYVGYKTDGLEIGLDPNGSAVIAYTDVEDIEHALKTLVAAGASIVKDRTDVGGGLVIAQVEVAGNVMGLRQPPK